MTTPATTASAGMGSRVRFADRESAGGRLGRLLAEMDVGIDAVLGLPRGGMHVAAGAAEVLQRPLDVALVRRMTIPVSIEIGAVGEHDVTVVDVRLRDRLAVTQDEIRAAESAQRALLAEGGRALRRAMDLSALEVVVIDDGTATSAMMSAACRVARTRGAQHVIAAVPVASMQTLERIDMVDRVYCLHAREGLEDPDRSYGDTAGGADRDVSSRR